MKEVAFEAIGEQVVTFAAASGAEEGKVGMISDNGTVDTCSAGTAFCGVIGKVCGGMAAVVLGGYVELPYSGNAPELGFLALVGDSDGGVKVAGSGETGRSCLVVKVDTTDKYLGLFL